MFLINSFKRCSLIRNKKIFFFSIDNIYSVKFEKEQGNHLQELKENKIKVNCTYFHCYSFFPSQRFFSI